jgi:class 3 adenylate cyclase/pimeloyl-ACP methyl ester carboxylesterase
MEPRIQYATTSDGVDIAYCVAGKGVPLVHTPNPPVGHLTWEWGMPEYREWYELLSSHWRLVRYDGRGAGLSDRRLKSYSLDELVFDLEAVVDSLGADRFILFGQFHCGPVAIAYAHRHPARVSHLVLWQSYVRVADYTSQRKVQATRAIVPKDWQTYTETFAHSVFGWEEGVKARQFARYIRESISHADFQVALDGTTAFDVSGLLPELTVPTLILHRQDVTWIPIELSRDLAKQIPQSRLVLLPGGELPPQYGQTTPIVDAIESFVATRRSAARQRSIARARRDARHEAPAFRTILFTDMAGSTALGQRLGDAGAQKLRRKHNKIVREALAAHNGIETKHTGDGIMASFGSATRALECAVAIQRAFGEPESTAGAVSPSPLPPEHGIRVRIGLNAGEPIAEERDLFGTAVDLAARIRDKAEPGEVLVSDVVRQLVAGKGFLFNDRGDHALKGFEDPVRVWEVRWRPTESEV